MLIKIIYNRNDIEANKSEIASSVMIETTPKLMIIHAYFFKIKFIGLPHKKDWKI